MKNSLEVARELLRDDGVIFVQCDDNEQAYLKVLMDEVFGRENFVNTIALRVSPPEGVKTSHATNTILKEKEYLHVYSRNKNLMTVIPCYIRADKWDTHYSSYIENIYEPIGNWKVVPLSKKLKEESLRPDLDDKDFVKWITNNSNKIFQLIDAGKYKNIQKYREDRFQWTDDKKIIIYRGRKVHFLSEGLKTTDEGLTLGRLLCDFWKDISFNNLFQEGGVSLIWGKKPEKLIKRILDMFTNANDIVLDYHLGTGTTCAVAHKMGRQYIGIEQLDYGENDSVVRLQDVINGDQSGISKSVNWQGGGDFIYCELAKWNETAKEKILESESLEELEKFFDEMYEKYFLNYNLKIKEFKEKVLQEENFRNLSLDEQKKIFITMLDNNQMYVNKTEMADKKFGISEEDQNLTNQFYNKEE